MELMQNRVEKQIGRKRLKTDWHKLYAVKIGTQKRKIKIN